jgi:hypothetical protein
MEHARLLAPLGGRQTMPKDGGDTIGEIAEEVEMKERAIHALWISGAARRRFQTRRRGAHAAPFGVLVFGVVRKAVRLGRARPCALR